MSAIQMTSTTMALILTPATMNLALAETAEHFLSRCHTYSKRVSDLPAKWLDLFESGRLADNARMTKTRLEAFSDGVIAILITIMVLELRIPHGDDLSSLTRLWPIFLTYVLSFVNLGIYWNNHHHMLQATRSIDGRVMWANLNLLFWLSLFPFVTGWMGENHFSSLPTAVYGVVMICAGASYTLLQTVIVSHHGDENEKLKQAIGRDLKGKVSIVMYAIAIALAFVDRWISFAIYAAVSAMWLIPDRRIERTVHTHDE